MIKHQSMEVYLYNTPSGKLFSKNIDHSNFKNFLLFENLTEKQPCPNSIAEWFLYSRPIPHQAPNKNLLFWKIDAWFLEILVKKSSQDASTIVPCPSWLPLHFTTNLFKLTIQNEILFRIFEYCLSKSEFQIHLLFEIILWFCLYMEFRHVNFVKSLVKRRRFRYWEITGISVSFWPVRLFTWHRLQNDYVVNAIDYWTVPGSIRKP